MLPKIHQELSAEILDLDPRNPDRPKIPDFPQLGFSGRPLGPAPSVRKLGLYLRLHKELEKGSLSNVVFCYSYSNKILLPYDSYEIRKGSRFASSEA